MSNKKSENPEPRAGDSEPGMQNLETGGATTVAPLPDPLGATEPSAADPFFSGRRHFPALDGLRAIAVIAVISLHIRGYMGLRIPESGGVLARLIFTASHHGAWGVDLFFRTLRLPYNGHPPRRPEPAALFSQFLRPPYAPHLSALLRHAALPARPDALSPRQGPGCAARGVQVSVLALDIHNQHKGLYQWTGVCKLQPFLDAGHRGAVLFGLAAGNPFGAPEAVIADDWLARGCNQHLAARFLVLPLARRGIGCLGLDICIYTLPGGRAAGGCGAGGNAV